MLFSSLIIIFFLLATTESGTRWLLQTTLDKVGNISVEEINGTLVNELSLKQLHYQEFNEFAVSIADFSLQWKVADLLNGHLHISKLIVNEINLKGQSATGEDNKINNQIPNIPLNISIDELIINKFNWIKGESKTEINKITTHAVLNQNDLTVSNLKVDMSELQLTADSAIKIQSDWPLTADVTWSYFLNHSAINGHLAINGDMNRFDIVSQIKGGIESNQNGFIRLSGDQPEFNLQGQWQKLQWPLLDSSPQARSQQGDFKIQGSAQHYQAQLNAKVSAMSRPGFSITLKGNGDQQGFDFKQLLIKPAQGQLKLTGQLSWDKAIAFDLLLIAKQLNPSNFGADIPGKLSLKSQSKGKVEGDKFKVALDIKQLSGVLNDQPLKARGKLTITNQKLKFQQLNISSGNNYLKTKGWLSEKNANLDVDINAPDLSTAWPSLTGSLQGKTTLKGSLKKPVINSNLKGNNLRFTDISIGDVSLLADYVHESKKQSTLDFTANSIQWAENKISHISLQGIGNQNNHNAQLELVSSLVNLDINTTGEWDGKRWFGDITQLTIDHPQFKKWQLQSTTSLTLSQSDKGLIIDLPNSCLTQSKSRLCLLAKGSSDTKINGHLLLSNWPLAATKVWLPEELDLRGLMSAQARFSYGNQDTTAYLSASTSKGQALIKDDNFVHKIPFSPSTFQLRFQDDELNSQLYLGLGHQDHMKANIKVDKEREGIRQLSGTIKANITNMTLLDGLLTEINNLQGQFIANLQLSGNNEKPIIIGSAQFQKGQFDIHQLGTTYRNIQLKMNSTTDNPDQLSLNAEMESGKGKLSAQGQLDLLTKHKYPLQVEITGKNFQVSRLPEAEVTISPKLTINKHKNLTKIEGLIKIDQAKIEIETLPENAVAPSEDEIIITADKSQKEVIDTSRINTQIDIEFGDNTHFSGFGLETRLAGKLQYIVKNNKQRMQGHTKMLDATYRSYGQDLTLRKGEFVFTGSTDNPWLNIEAVRKANKDDITAILALTGLLKSPKTRIYTEPALPESEALAYLVTGKSLNAMNQSEGNAVANAAFSYGVNQLSWISDQLGIDEFEVEQSDKIEDSAIKLGEYLNPDLYVGITLGLFSNKYSANLKYNLSDSFSIDTRAGESQRIDIKYHIETD
ncbi:MAG: translocation/assembly module TamB domain-containing protein [Methylococcales bacterium]|nr:translocation/assembly module TamB domain-containing protein [Methylococcales bacterium]